MNTTTPVDIYNSFFGFRERPFTLRRGQMVRDVARLVHKDLERSLRYARVTGRSGFEGQHVGPDHVVDDGDVIELHS